MLPIKHGFFEAIERIAKADAWNGFAGETFPKHEFLNALRVAHPIVFDKKCTEEGVMNGGIMTDMKASGEVIPPAQQILQYEEQIKKHAANSVEEFSLPFGTSLYLFTDPPIVARRSNSDDKVMKLIKVGLLLKEISPERTKVFEILLAKVGPERGNTFLPVCDSYELDLTKIDESFASDILTINAFSNMISVKRIGIEHKGSVSMKTKGHGSGVTVLKYDNIFHIANKVEYDYTPSLAEDAKINWDFQGFWRGHWRAFYVKDSKGDNMKDVRGWNVVDYGRLGKNRQGEYNVPGYTWVVEHIKGNAQIAEIKTRIVKHR